MKRPYLSFLHCIIALLACCTGLFANAEKLDSQSGTFTPDGTETPLFSWTYYNDVQGSTYYPNCRVQLVDETKFSEYTKVLVICQLWQGNNAKQDNVINLSVLDVSHSAQGYCTFADMQAGEYRTTLVVKFFDNNNTEKANYTLNLDNITVEEGTEQPNPPTPSTAPTGKLTYTIDGLTCNFKVELENIDGYNLQAINVWAEDGGVRSFQQTSTENPFEGSFTVTGVEPGQTKTYWVKAEAIFDGLTIAGNDKTNMVGTDDPHAFTNPGQPVEKQNPTISISDPTFSYKDATSVIATLKYNYQNPDGVEIKSIRLGAVAGYANAVEGATYLRDWANENSENADIVWGDITLPANQDTGDGTATFTLNNLPENRQAIDAYFKAYITLADDRLIISTPDAIKFDVSTIPSTTTTLAKEINSETYKDDKYDGISYLHANFQEDNETLVWTFPEWAYDEQYTAEQRANGISGRYVKVVKSASQGWWAPTIPYTIGNDEFGYIHATLDIPGDVPTGFDPQFVVNNNTAEAGATTLTKGDDGKWHFKSLHPYPTNRTISYYFRAAWADGGQLQTRSFGYKVENVTYEKSEPYTLTTLAEKAFGEGNVSGQIYLCHAHDTATDITDNEMSDGYWNSIHRPCDYANLNTSNFRFCPAFWYIIANDANNPGKVFVAVQFVEDINTVIPSDFVPVFNIYDPDKLSVEQGEATASLRAKKFLADDQIVEHAVKLSQVPGMVNTYQGTTSGTYDANKKIAVGMKFQYTSIIRGNGFSSTAPRYYVMSSDDKVVTGIEEVGAGQEAVPALSTVYNLQGVAVRVNVATETALEGLPAGIYIVNGRKWAVR